MRSTSQSLDGLSGTNLTDNSTAKLGSDQALQMLAQAFEMDWNPVHSQAVDEPGSWPMGRTIWLALFVSGGLWACIAGIVWFA
jgi:hypothetical protein